MDYVIKNSKQVYIRLNEKGSPVTCGEGRSQSFEFSKAKNLCSSLPKKLRRMNFRVEPIPDIQSKPKEVVESNVYKVSDEILRWQDKFKTCDEVINEAKKRISELESLLHDNSQKFVDIIHKIELEDDKNMYLGWKLYVAIRTSRRERRVLKDEMLILKDVVRMNFSNFSSELIDKTIAGLATRKYTMRILEEDGDINDSL